MTMQLDALDEEGARMDRLRGHSITYRIGMGLPERHLLYKPCPPRSHSDQLAKANGFSLNAGVWAGANDRAQQQAEIASDPERAGTQETGAGW